MRKNKSILRSDTVCVVLFLCCVGVTGFAGADGLTDAQARYKQELSDCKNNRSGQGQATCQREARNALAEFKRGQLDQSSEATYLQNQRQRCEVHSGDDRAACDARMRGAGSVKGSVSGGGLLREIEVITPSPSK
jgi:hypothetical protein